jgi:hypothetical protein
LFYLRALGVAAQKELQTQASTPRHAVTRVRGLSLRSTFWTHMTTTVQLVERTYSVPWCVHIVLDHQRSVTDTCTIHSNHSCKSSLSEAVSTSRPRDPRRLVPSFRGRGHRIGGAEAHWLRVPSGSRNSGARALWWSTPLVGSGGAEPSESPHDARCAVAACRG